MLETVIFDLGWTLVDGISEVEFISQGMTEAGRMPDVQAGMAALRRLVLDFNSEVDLMPSREDLAAFYARLGRELDYDVAGRMEAYPERWRPFPEAKQVVTEARARGYRVGLLSNWGPTGEVVLDRNGLRPFFDDVVFSYQHGMLKPSPAIFRLAAERLGSMPANCLMVGDNLPFDVWGALSAGMGAFWVNRKGLKTPAMIGTGMNLEPLLDLLPARAERPARVG